MSCAATPIVCAAPPGSFGLPQASVVAAELEDATKRWLEHPANGVAGRGQAARGFVRRLAAALFTKQATTAPVTPDPPPTFTNLQQPPPTSDAAGASEVPEVILVEDDPALAENY